MAVTYAASGGECTQRASKRLQAANPSYLVSPARHLASVIGATATQHSPAFICHHTHTLLAIATPARARRRAPWPAVSGWTVAHYNVAATPRSQLEGERRSEA